MKSDIERLEDVWSSLDNKYESLLVDERVSRLIRGNSVAHRFGLLTQLAGVFLNSSRNLLALQSGSSVDGSWDPRSFASKVIVPWLRDHRSPLGNSGDPYVSNPMRRPTISPSPEGVKRSHLPLWKDLFEILDEAKDDPTLIEATLRQAVAIIRKMLDEQDRPLQLPDRISPQVVLSAVEIFLSTPSGGDRAMAVSAAIFAVLIGPLIGIVEVDRNVVNASDDSSGAPGDVICRDGNGRVIIVAEIKERSLSFEDVRSALERDPT